MKSTKGIYIALVICAVVFGQKCGKKLAVPDEIIGKWETSDPNYEACFFELKKEEIIFKTAEGDINVYAISKIKREKESLPEKVSYSIYYADREGLEYMFPLYYSPADNGEIRFKNQQQIVWTRGKEGEIPRKNQDLRLRSGGVFNQ